uniref:Uncharacterized protein n=1 Tax=Caenorhabditis japonica TaxID=281687 RepID=A0A8R1DJ08_CAEJA
MHGSRSETCPFSAPRIQPSPHFGRRQTHAMMMHKNMDQNEDHQRHHRSPSIDSVSRLHQQSGGFAGHQRRGSFSSKENGVGGSGGFYHPHHHNNGGFRRQNYNQRGRHNQQRDYHSGQYHQQTTSSEYSQQNMFNNGYQPKSQNRSYQNPLHIAAANQQPQRPIFNSTNDRNFAAEFGAFSSFRRPSPSTPPSPNGTAASGVVPRHLEESPLVRRTTDRQSSPAEKMLTSSGSGVTHELEQQQQHEKIHMYRAAGTAPGGYSTGSSPFKMSPTQPPSTPSADKNAEEWQRQFQMPPPQSTFQQFRRGPHEQQTMELQLKTAEVLPISLPTTPSAVGGTQFRAAMKDAPMTRSVDSVDAKHPCFSDERMHSALIGTMESIRSELFKNL